MNAPLNNLIAIRDQLSAAAPERPDARFLSGEFYCSPEIAQIEKAKIFLKSWLCVAREEEVAKPGDYVAMRIVDEPIVLVRGADSVLRAFMNMCLHRGVEVAQGCGNARVFVCPYHSWSYDTSGTLRAAPFTAGSVKRGTQSLSPLKLATWRGWVFVSFDPDVVPFEQYIQPFEDDLWYYQTEECRIADKIYFYIPCNWKFVTENISDYYHLRAVHSASSGQFYQLGDDELPLRTYANGGATIVFDSSLRKTDTILPFPQLTWLKETAFSAKGAMFPNVNFWCGLDSLRMWHIWPVTPDRTQAVCYVLLPKASFDVPDFDAKMERYRGYVKQIMDEDTQTLISLQSAASSARFVPGPITHLEAMVHHLVRHYAAVMAS